MRTKLIAVYDPMRKGLKATQKTNQHKKWRQPYYGTHISIGST